ncbi:glycerophosphodiester phosphodiesterase GDPD1, chloroplastic-like [Phalaenopsis equestris]|uniref:glycerophosphodiester phosphodiesterase GDPD1, chloroplastic-like n=1 Tax=Phalaenopsis equestris TaxID=78828 RepID=UPI0009E21E83|nr:glycerophosphodiester phosphodiesterase GDPD1, chloroplastic-like [Phalaenopsis equestris]
MALKAVPIIEIPTIDQVPELHSLSVSSLCTAKPARFAVIGHRGNGMNSISSAIVRENSILSFNSAARFPIPYIEFDVQVTRDGVPIIFHDDFILSGNVDAVFEHRVTDLSLEEFLSYGSQRKPEQIRSGKPLLRRSADGMVFDWVVEADDPLCTLEEAFRQVDPRLGFNIELKFDDNLHYPEEDLINTLQIVLRSVSVNAGARPVIFSSFQPDAARLIRRLERNYPVFFLTDGGLKIHGDERRNSLEAAVKLCVENGLEGIVSEVRAVLRNPAEVAGIKEANLRLLTYGGLNNTAEVVYMQQMMGIDGVIVDRVKEVSEAVLRFSGEEGGEGRPNFSEAQLSCIRKLVAELVRQ